jgi:hypothetical protein
MIDSGLGPAKGPACDCCSICYLLAPVSCTPRVGSCAVDVAQMAAAAMALTAEAYDTTAVQTAARGAVRSLERDAATALPVLRNPACSTWCRLAWLTG